MNRRKRIALYGGTFDPVHLGHLAVASRVSELFEIGELLFVPAKRAPHKVSRPVTAATHRYAMLALATQNERRFLISQFELDAPSGGYTVDTLAHFQLELGDSADLFFIMGADSWSEITTWRHWQRVLEMANHVVVTRPGHELDAGDLPASLRAKLVDVRGAKPERIAASLGGAGGRRIFITDAVMMDIAATDIRRVARAETARLAELVPPAVAEYIEKYGLYRD